MSIGILNKTGTHKMPPEEQEKKLPFFVYMLLTGAEVTENYMMKRDVVRIFWDNKEYFLHVNEYEIVRDVTRAIWDEVVKPNKLLPSLLSPTTMMDLLIEAQGRIKQVLDPVCKGKKRVLFLKADDTGCGYWRIVVPARHLNPDKYLIDVLVTDLVYDYLLYYDTIVVQRRCDWRQMYVIDKLKSTGKKIIYDIDDDIMNVPEHNPAHKSFGNDEKEAAKAIMALSDYIVTPSKVIMENYGLGSKGVFYPNSLDLSTYPEVDRSSKDGKVRILWAGSSTHEMDWQLCVDAIDTLMMECPELELLFMGYMPRVVNDYVETKSYWKDHRVKYTPFKELETYLALMKNVVADIAVCPLRDDVFNRSKSCLKFVEYSAQGLPVVASNVTPYKEVMAHDETGLLAVDSQDWYALLKELIKNPEKRKLLSGNARKVVERDFDVKKNIKIWENIL